MILLLRVPRGGTLTRINGAPVTASFDDPIEVDWQELDGPEFTVADLTTGSRWTVVDRRLGEDAELPIYASVVRSLSEPHAELQLEYTWHLKYWSPRDGIMAYTKRLIEAARAWSEAQASGRTLTRSHGYDDEDDIMLELTLRAPGCDLKTLFAAGEEAHRAILSAAGPPPADAVPRREDAW